MIRYVFSLLTVLLLTNCKSINYSKIRKENLKASQIDYELGNLIFKKKFKIDTISMVSKKYQNKILAEFEIGKLKTKLLGEFYFNDNELFFAQFFEQSSIFKQSDNANKTTEFNYENKKITEEKSRTGIPTELTCLGLPKNLDEAIGYDQNLTLGLLKELTLRVIEVTNELQE